jgi:GntR family transcriptional regulator/MocR family aminotransferase
MVAPDRLAGAVVAAKASDDLGTPVVEQLALADFLERGELDRHLRRTRGVYRARRDALVAALAHHLPGCRPAGVAAGLHLVVQLAESTDERAVLERARERGVGLYGLSEHRIAPGPPALLLGYGRIAEPAIESGAAELAAAVRYAA